MSPGSTLTALFARQLLLARTRVVQQGDVTALDGLHHAAVRYGVVSPYSSMLVLVSAAQRERLRKAEQEQDRFARETETGKEQLGHPSSLLHVEGTPEPAQGLLFVCALGALLLWQRRRRGRVRQYVRMTHPAWPTAPSLPS
jgi:MYXO-CTERM domain-containing protein